MKSAIAEITNDIIEVLRCGEMTVYEIAECLERNPVKVMHEVRQLQREGLIENTGLVRVEDSRNHTPIWRLPK